MNLNAHLRLVPRSKNVELYVYYPIAGITQSVQRLAMGWTVEGSEFESWWGQEFLLLHAIQNGSGAHPASYPMDTGGSFPGGKLAGA
jgi:hypothetical protein